MRINDTDVKTVVHETNDPQAVRTYLDSVNEDVVSFQVVPYAREPNVIKYLIVLAVKVV